MTFQQVFDKYMQEFGSFFYLSDHIPMLGDVRGKIVLVRRFDVDGPATNNPNLANHGLRPLPWQDNTTFSANYFDSSTGAYFTFWIQDQYNVDSEDIPTKIQEIQDLLDGASADPSPRDFYINFTSAVGAFFTPYDDAMQIHPWLYGYLGQVFANRLGVLMMDFPDDFLIQRIVGLNDALKTQSQSTDRNSALMAAAAG